jgi:chitinase
MSKDKKSTFSKAISATKNLVLENGLKALEKDHSSKIDVKGSKIVESVFLDKCLAKSDPQGSRWDYIIGYNEEAYFVEVHSAITSEVSTVLRKLDWLKNWLFEEGSEVNKIKTQNCYHWIQSSKFDILKSSRQYKLASQNGILPKSKLVLSK